MLSTIFRTERFGDDEINIVDKCVGDYPPKTFAVRGVGGCDSFVDIGSGKPMDFIPLDVFGVIINLCTRMIKRYP
jgi:hypothetical protein